VDDDAIPAGDDSGVDPAVTAILDAREAEEVAEIAARRGDLSPPKPAAAVEDTDDEPAAAAKKPDEPPTAAPQAEPTLGAIARRERRQLEWRRREQAKIAQERAQLAAERAQLAAAKAPPTAPQLPQSVDELRRLAARDPARFYRDFVGIKRTGDVANLLLADELGDKAPSELRQVSGLARIEAELDELRNQNASLRDEIHTGRQAEEDRRLMESYERRLHTGLAEIPDACKYVRRIAKRSPDRAVGALVRVAASYAKQHPDQAAPTPKQLIELLERSLAEELNPFLEDDPRGSEKNHREQARSEAKPKAPPATIGSSLVGTHRTGGRADEDDEDTSIEAITRDLKAGKHLVE
jgi:hypothetical protein